MPEGISRPPILFDRYTLPDGMEMRWGLTEPSGEVRANALVVYGKGSYTEKFPSVPPRLADLGLRSYFLELPGQGRSDPYTDDLSKRNRVHVSNFRHLVWSLDNFYSCRLQNQTDKPLVVIGHSQGALVEWIWEMRNPQYNIAASVWVAPQFDFTVPNPRRMANKILKRATNSADTNSIPKRIDRPVYGTVLMWIGARIGLGTRYCPGEGDYNPDKVEFNEETNDRQQHEMNKRLVANHPELAYGGVTIGWYAAAEEAIRGANKLARAGSGVTTDVLVLVGEKDPTTPTRLVAPVVGGMKNATLIEIPGADHNIPGGTAAIRQMMFGHIATFLDQKVFG